MNIILSPDYTLKNIVSVNEIESREIGSNISILTDDIFIENAPPIPDGLHTPQLLADWQTVLEADPLAIVWTEANQAAQDAENHSKSFKAIENAIDAHILKTAQAKGYNSTESCLTYLGDSNPTWNAEAQAFKDWRSACWQYVIAEQAKVDAGTRTMPTPQEAVAELPAMVWP